MPNRAKFYVAIVLLVGTIALVAQLLRFTAPDPLLFAIYFLLTVLASAIRLRLPTVLTTLSVNFLSILVGIVLFNRPEAILLAIAGTVVQSLWRPRTRPEPIHVAFTACSAGLAVMAAHTVFHGSLTRNMGPQNPLLLALTATVYVAVNSGLIAGLLALMSRKPFCPTWYRTYFWVLPYYFAAGSTAWLIVVLGRQITWEAALVLLPLVYFVYRSHRMSLDRLEADKEHVEEIAGLHLRTIEALALAIEAKDTTTARPPATRARLRHRDWQGDGHQPERTRCLAGRLAASRYRQAGRSRTHHFQAGPPDSRRIRKDEDPPIGRSGDSGGGQVPLPGGPDCAGASREVGWLGLSIWAFRR